MIDVVTLARIRWAWACRQFGGEPLYALGGERRDGTSSRCFYGHDRERKARRDARRTR